MGRLEGAVALVTGGTRGAGRGIAVQLGAAGATVYVTGRTTRESRSPMNRPETIEETAELVTAAGGTGIPVRVDHSDRAQVQALVERIRAEQDGRLDVLVNDIWGGDPLTEWDKPFWEHDLDNGLRMLRQAVETHIVTSWYAAPLMVARRRGLIVEVTDGLPDSGYRGSLFYDLVKSAVIRLAAAQAEDLRPYGVAAVALTPGFLRSEAVLDHFGVTEENWRDAIAKDPHFAHSETPAYIGRAVVALAGDPDIMARTGQALATWRLAKEYGFTDADGTQPDWGSYFQEVVLGGLTPRPDGG
ncbi:short-chain dehydrogenase [Carbonactinospora thermoautotrophica]|uniref:Short-chain dehydrogenase n=1 Tax=Carbonactinospora thermoautotrophica TaxID=1469144 RepID=A0A132N3C4_9ACTN|nr:SDR family oxidoreductase [Carbonactinospora thermoautotrophica]KWX04648.1 short-chain dehydrogenase [Carbonactinospora thermoautotrophica]KWX06974.1 short-chain dehydrogenase [Carbonactinospora thermoautotrophica]